MDSRLKERLIGAAVLVALGVWLIPWLLDGAGLPPESAEPVLELPAEADSAPVRAQTIRLDHAAGEASSQGPSTIGAPAVAHVAARTNPGPEGSGQAGSGLSGQWLVQLGSFGDAANAQQLARRVGEFGHNAAVSDVKASGKVMHRVRLGPYATRGEAEAVTSSLSVHGFVAQVVQEP
jgi:DedD protein